MLGLGPDAHRRLRGGETLAVVTVVRVPSSAPRGVGASMAVTADGDVIGSVSGGCVEADAVVLARLTLHDGQSRTATYGIAEADAATAGLACGGRIDVLTYRVHVSDPTVRAALDAEDRDRALSVGLVVSGVESGRLVMPDAGPVADDLERARLLGETRMLRREDRDGPDILALTSAARPRLIIAGAGEHAAALCRVAAATGFAVTVCDPWETLATRERFPDAARLVVAAPHVYLGDLPPDEIDLRTAVCILTHDERLDVPALEVALSLPVGFVGAMGARRTVARRARLLADRGVTADVLGRLHSPLGMDLGGVSPEETAIAVLAEIVAARHGGTGQPLRDRTGPLHRHPVDEDPSASRPLSVCAPPHPAGSARSGPTLTTRTEPRA